MTAQEQLALLAETILDRGGMPSEAQLAAMGLDEPTARGIQSVIWLSKEGDPEARRAVEAMADLADPQLQITQPEAATDANIYALNGFDGANSLTDFGIVNHFSVVNRAPNGESTILTTPETVGTEESSELIVRDRKYLKPDGNVDWNTWAPDGGRVPGTIKEGQTLEVGTIIDRYGNPYGKYASPAGVPYDQRALPYVENRNVYHRYEVLKPISDVVSSQIAKAFEQPGGGVQYELPASIYKLIKEGFIREVAE